MLAVSEKIKDTATLKINIQIWVCYTPLEPIIWTISHWNINLNQIITYTVYRIKRILHRGRLIFSCYLFTVSFCLHKVSTTFLPCKWSGRYAEGSQYFATKLLKWAVLASLHKYINLYHKMFICEEIIQQKVWYTGGRAGVVLNNQ